MVTLFIYVVYKNTMSLMSPGVLYATDELLHTTSETHDVLYVS